MARVKGHARAEEDQQRKKLPDSVRAAVLHEAGYMCANPRCRTIITLEIHHIEYMSESGGDVPENLLPLCPNCHSLHHMKKITRESIRTWKFLLLALNEAFDRRSVELLLALDRIGMTTCSGDGLVWFAALLASGFVKSQTICGLVNAPNFGKHEIKLSEKGRIFVDAWKRGDQEVAVRGLPSANLSTGQETTR